MKSGPDQLRDWLARRGMNQAEAAELLHITAVFLSQLINAKRQPGLANAIKLERETGIPAESWLLTSVSKDDREPVTTGGNRKVAKR